MPAVNMGYSASCSGSNRWSMLRMAAVSLSIQSTLLKRVMLKICRRFSDMPQNRPRPPEMSSVKGVRAISGVTMMCAPSRRRADT